MTRQEKFDLCSMLAEWEWRQGGSSDSASTRMSCLQAVVRTMNLKPDDLLWARASAICELFKATDDEAFFDYVYEAIRTDYEGLIDRIEIGENLPETFNK